MFENRPYKIRELRDTFKSSGCAYTFVFKAHPSKEDFTIASRKRTLSCVLIVTDT